MDATARLEGGVIADVTHHTTRDGVRQRVRTWTPEATPWASVLIVHGFVEHSGRYARTGSLLAQAGLAVRAFDLRGHGETEGPHAYVERFTLFLDDVSEHLALLAEAKLPLVLLGHSMGGLIATRYAIDRSPAPDALVLSAPALDANAPPVKRFLAPVLSRLLPRLELDASVERGRVCSDPAVEDAYFADPLVWKRTTTRLGAELFATMDETSARLHALTVPTWVGHGSDDTLVPTRFSEPLGALPCAERHVYPGLRHEILNERQGPQIITEIVAFLKKTLT